MSDLRLAYELQLAVLRQPWNSKTRRSFMVEPLGTRAEPYCSAKPGLAMSITS